MGLVKIAKHVIFGQCSVNLIRTSKNKYEVVYGKQVTSGLTKDEAMEEYKNCIHHQLECDGAFDIY